MYATSADGVVWAKQGVALDLGGSGQDALGLRNPMVITRAGRYELWYQGRSANSPYYHVMRATSSDGLTWTRAGEVTLHPDAALDGSEMIHASTP